MTASIVRGESVSDAMVRWKRESACRCAAGLRRRGHLGVRLLAAAAGVRRRAGVTRRAAAAPGSTTRRKSSASSQSCRRAREIRAAARADGVPRPERDDRAAAAPAGGLDQARLTQRRHRLAQRGPRDPEPLGQVPLGGQRASRAGRRRAGSRSPAAPRTPRRRGAPAPAAAPLREGDHRQAENLARDRTPRFLPPGNYTVKLSRSGKVITESAVRVLSGQNVGIACDPTE